MSLPVVAAINEKKNGATPTHLRGPGNVPWNLIFWNLEFGPEL